MHNNNPNSGDSADVTPAIEEVIELSSSVDDKRLQLILQTGLRVRESKQISGYTDISQAYRA